MNWQVSSFKLDPWNTAKERLVIFALNIIFKKTHFVRREEENWTFSMLQFEVILAS